MIDPAEVDRSLRVDGLGAVEPPPWLIDSWRDPLRFDGELCSWHDAIAPLSSVPARRYALFSDLVLRHAAIDSPALVWYEAGTRRELRFADLALAAGRRAAAWQGEGAGAGKRVAIVRDFGPELVISVLAALKLGLIFALVPRSQRRLARARLLTSAPDFIDCDRQDAPLVGDETPRLPASPRGSASPDVERAHVHRAGEAAALVFDPAAPDPTLARPVTCDVLFSGALVDGPIALGLRRGHLVAAPEMPLLATQPALLLTTLLSGAGVLCLTLDEIARAPAMLVDRSLQSLGVTTALRDLLVRLAPSLGPRCASWFRDPLASSRLEPWQELIARTELHEAAAINLRWEAALGGCTLFSPRRIGRAHCDVYPAAGRTWSLVDFVRDDAPAMGPGRLAITPTGDAAPAISCALVLPAGRGWLSGGAMPTHPRGRTYPATDAVAVARSVAGCRDALVVLDPSAAEASPRVVLMLFCEADSERVRAAVLERLAIELGGDDLPDEVAAFALFPRRDDQGAADARWCHQQFRDGGLARKSSDEWFRLLSRLRARVVPMTKEPA